MTREESSPTKARILEAAVAEFGEQGLEGARVERIARRARVNKQMLYYYFGSKDELYARALEDVYDGIVANMTEHQAQSALDNPADKVLALFEAYFDYLRDHPEYVSIIANENLHRGRHLETSDVEELTHPAVEYASRLLIENDLLPEGFDTRDYIVAGLAMAFFYFSNQYSLAKIFGADLFQEDAQRRYLAGLRAMMSTPMEVKAESVRTAGA